MAQPIPPNYMAYDRTIVVFSPDGRLLQVEYARQMVKNGSTSLGVVFKDGVILATIKPSMTLAVTESYQKIHEIDDHIAIVSSGSLADARDLIRIGRIRSQITRITYGEPISVRTLTKHICERKHLVTQYAGVRPYGVGLLVGGIDHGPRLYETEPSGTMLEWKAQAIGRGAEKSRKILTTGFKENMTEEDCLSLLLKSLKAGEKEVTPHNMEIVIVGEDKVERLSEEKLKKLKS